MRGSTVPAKPPRLLLTGRFQVPNFRFPMTDHRKLLPKLLEKMFPLEEDQALVVDIMGRYGHEEFHREAERVKMAILKLAGRSPERIRYYTLMACRDYRDVLSAAEYPNQVGKDFLREKDPARYSQIVEKDKKQYQDWYLGVLWGKSRDS